jgi:hypothetical protein
MNKIYHLSDGTECWLDFGPNGEQITIDPKTGCELKEYYIQIEGACESILAVAHVWAISEEDAVNKAREAYTAQLFFTPVTENEAKIMRNYDGVDIINRNGDPEEQEVR